MYRVQLDPFEGPLDLLLFFIRRDEVDIADIPIGRIADEYLETVRTLAHLDLDAAADFVFTAALLIQIKARMLLPRPELDADGEPVDPRTELVERLLEYVRYKEAAQALGGRFEARLRHAPLGAAHDERDRLAPPPEVTVRATVFDLVAALGRAVARAAPEAEPVHAVARERFAVDVQAAWLVGRLGARAERFTELVARRSRGFVIATFLAVLDLAQRQTIRLVLGATPDEFAVELADAPVDAPEPVAP